jgi:hypothetical protein
VPILPFHVAITVVLAQISSKITTSFEALHLHIQNCNVPIVFEEPEQWIESREDASIKTVHRSSSEQGLEKYRTEQDLFQVDFQLVHFTHMCGVPTNSTGHSVVVSCFWML